MSTRFYPLYNRGNPQLRIFLPNFWMKLAKPREKNPPPNRIQFQVSLEMSKFDVKNYLEKIYKVPVLDVKTFVRSGSTHRYPYSNTQELYKDDDIKMAMVILPKHIQFEFPDVTKDIEEDKTKLEKATKQMDQVKAQFKRNYGVVGGRRRGAPTFFGL